MPAWLLPTITIGYLLSLFAVAWYGDRRAARDDAIARRGHATALFYAMTMLVYFTTWSFYGSVGRASLRGFDFAAIYVGPALILIFGRRVMHKMITIAKDQNVTSIADFIAARYGKSLVIAAMVTIGAIIAMLPYIALQLRAVATTWDVLTGTQSAHVHPIWGDTALGVTVLMALFSVLFGIRHIHASEHHRGLMLVIAFESVIKLSVFVVVAVFIVFGLADGFGDVANRVLTNPELGHLALPDLTQPSWWANLVLSSIAFLCLPHMFHVTVVENDDPRHITQAAWLLPLYMLVLSLFIVPIAVVGLSRLGFSVDPDTYVMTLPLSAGRQDLGLLAFIGGLSAATGMVIVAAVALSTMVCNDLVLPILLGRSPRGLLPGEDISRLLLLIRRIAVVVILMLSYGTYRLIDRSNGLVTVGLLSFVAVAQFGPAFIGGLFWRQGGRAGAIGGLCAGFAVWAYTLLLPSLFPSGSAPGWLDSGPLGLGWLMPQALFGLTGLDSVSHATTWSLAANILVYIVLSLWSRPSAIDRAQASIFVTGSLSENDGMGRRGALPVTPEEMEVLAARYLGADRARAAFAEYRESGVSSTASRLHAMHFTERLLAGAIGAASARVVLAASLQSDGLSLATAKGMLDEANMAIQFNRNLLAATLENVGQGICVLDRDLRVATWNTRYLELCGLPEGVVRVGTPYMDLVRYNLGRGEYRSEDMGSLLTNLDLSRTRWPYIYERRRPDGTVLEICFTRMPDGGLVGTFTDVTERHRAATQLEEANASLEERVIERTIALTQAKAEADRANQDKTRFLAAASHDLMQPLSAARLFLSALHDRVERPADRLSPDERESERNLVANAAQSLHSVEQLLVTLLDISALDSGAVRPQFREFSIDAIISRLGLEFAEVARSRGLRLRCRPCHAVVRSDPQLLRRILQNFLSNALRYTREGGVLIGCRRRGQDLRIEVWDSGPGIPEAKWGEIFHEFRRLETDDGQEKGLGLGLAIVERIANKLKHPLTLLSRPGRGSLFAVSVPLGLASPEILASSEDDRREDPVAGLAVLCIDNEAAILEGLGALLRGWGCRVRTASRYDVALRLASEAAPDAVIVDYHLDGGNTGLELLARLRREWSREIPALLVTADRSEPVRAQAKLQGVDMIYKPARPAALRTWLGRIARSVRQTT